MFKLFIPKYHVKSIYTIDYKALYDKGIRLIFLDLDNTLITYSEKMPTEKLFSWKEKLTEMGFTLMIVSNSHKNRVLNFSNEFKIDCIQFAKKPLKSGFKRAMEFQGNKFKPQEICEIGDQVMTDVLGANRMHFTSILVDPIDRSTELLVTRINRIYEAVFKALVKLFHPKLYKASFKEYKGE